MYKEPTRIDSANAEVMSESYATGQDGDMEIIWVTFDDGLTVSIARSSRTPNEMTVRGWNDPDDGPVLQETVKAAKLMVREIA